MLYNVMMLTRAKLSAILVKGKWVLKSQRKVNFAVLLWHNIKIAIRMQNPPQFSMIR